MVASKAEPLVRNFLGRLKSDKDLRKDVILLVKEHMQPLNLYKARSDKSDRAVRRLAKRVGRIDRLIRVSRADAAARPPMDPHAPQCAWLKEIATKLMVEKAPPEPIIKGSDLIALGVKPGPEMGEILKKIYKMQLDGDFTERECGVIMVRDLMS